MAKSGQLFGFDQLAKKLQTLSDPKELGATMKKSVKSAMTEVKKEAQKRIPVGAEGHVTYQGRLVAPGFAKRSIRVISKLDKKSASAYALLGVRAEAYYAIQFIELGTFKMPAHPWLRPAFLSSSDRSVKMVGEGIKDWILGVADKHKTGVYGGGRDRAAQLIDSLGD